MEQGTFLPRLCWALEQEGETQCVRWVSTGTGAESIEVDVAKITTHPLLCGRAGKALSEAALYKQLNNYGFKMLNVGTAEAKVKRVYSCPPWLSRCVWCGEVKVAAAIRKATHSELNQAQTTPTPGCWCTKVAEHDWGQLL
eukprot:m.228754 g.228754  ORF g.228754 m.228754 type:complete len:141 (+) comp17587_c0_seq1:233-655(+)